MTIKEIIAAVRAEEIELDDHHDYRLRVMDWLRQVAAMVKHAEQNQVEKCADELDEGIRFFIVHGNATEEEVDEIRKLAKRSSIKLPEIPENSFA